MAVNGYFSHPVSMGIIYTVVSRGTIILAQFASHQGNFTEVCQQVLEQVPTEVDGKLTYAARDYMYHYVCEDGIVYMCITDDEFERSRAFLFLENIKNKFQRMFGDKVHRAKSYAMNSDFSRELANEMQSHSETTLSLVNLDSHIQLDGIGIRDLDLTGRADLEPLELLASDDYSLQSFESGYILAHHRSRWCCRCTRRYSKVIIVITVILFIMMVIAGGVAAGVCFDTHKCGFS